MGALLAEAYALKNWNVVQTVVMTQHKEAVWHVLKWL